MSIRLFALPCGWLEADLGLFLEGETGKIRVPVPSWLVLHPAGALVFDSGLHLATQTDAEDDSASSRGSTASTSSAARSWPRDCARWTSIPSASRGW